MWAQIPTASARLDDSRCWARTSVTCIVSVSRFVMSRSQGVRSIGDALIVQYIHVEVPRKHPINLFVRGVRCSKMMPLMIGKRLWVRRNDHPVNVDI